MEKVALRKPSRRETNDDDDLKGKSPQELIGMLWRLALNAWSFKEKLNAEPDFKDMVSCLNDAKIKYIV